MNFTQFCNRSTNSTIFETMNIDETIMGHAQTYFERLLRKHPDSIDPASEDGMTITTLTGSALTEWKKDFHENRTKAPAILMEILFDEMGQGQHMLTDPETKPVIALYERKVVGFIVGAIIWVQSDIRGRNAGTRMMINAAKRDGHLFRNTNFGTVYCIPSLKAARKAYKAIHPLKSSDPASYTPDEIRILAKHA